MALCLAAFGKGVVAGSVIRNGVRLSVIVNKGFVLLFPSALGAQNQAPKPTSQMGTP